MSTTPVWVVNGGATTVTSPPPHPTGFTTPVWVVNATDSVSKLSVPTTIEEPSTSYTSLISVKRDNFVKGGLYTEPFPFTNTARDLQFSGSSVDVVYSMYSLASHACSVATQQEWVSSNVPYALIRHGVNAYNDHKLVHEKGIFSFFMPLDQAGFNTKVQCAAIFVPPSAIFNVTIESYARVDTGLKYAKTIMSGHTLATGQAVFNATIPDLSERTSGCYFANSANQNQYNLLKFDWISGKYDSTHWPEMIFGNAVISYILQFA